MRRDGGIERARDSIGLLIRGEGVLDLELEMGGQGDERWGIG
jgi:hypothetical protein